MVVRTQIKEEACVVDAVDSSKKALAVAQPLDAERVEKVVVQS
jgi:hypothetical protein